MKTYPYTTDEGIIELVRIEDLSTARSQLIGMEAENAGLRADNAELLARLIQAAKGEQP